MHSRKKTKASSTWELAINVNISQVTQREMEIERKREGAIYHSPTYFHRFELKTTNAIPTESHLGGHEIKIFDSNKQR